MMPAEKTIEGKLRVLFVEDTPTDMEILLSALWLYYPDIAHRRVDRLDELDVVLSEEHWDLIVCDYFLDGFTPKEVVGKIRALDIDPPIIVASGSVNEELLMELMTLGVDDCILKDNPKRLATAAPRAIAAAGLRAEKRLALQQLRESESKNRDLHGRQWVG